MKQAILVLSHVTLLSLVLEGCLSLYLDAERLQRAIPRLLLPSHLDNSFKSNGPDTGSDWGNPSGVKLSKRQEDPRENIDGLIADIMSALDYLEEERQQSTDLLDKKGTPSRRQHNFVRIGKRKVADCGPSGCNQGLRGVHLGLDWTRSNGDFISRAISPRHGPSSPIN